MLGWSITVMDKSLEVPNESGFDPRFDLLAKARLALLAAWEASPRGIDWLNDLAKAGKAACHWHSDGTGRYRALARDVLPLIANGPPANLNPVVLTRVPDHPISENWVCNVVFHQDRIASCHPDQKLMIDVCDSLDGDDILDIISELDNVDALSDEELADIVGKKRINYYFSVRLSDEDDLTTGKLAQWEVGVRGLDWLNDLVKDGKSALKSRGGYPSTYMAMAGDVLPLIKNGPPFIDGDSWTSDVILHQDRMASCPQDRMLTIEAWDMS